jgi:hypothetical protein
LTFEFDRLGVRVPAILISPWIPKGTVVAGPYEPNGRTFEHASIPRTVTQHFIGEYTQATAREKRADTFLDLFSDTMRPESDCPVFDVAIDEDSAVAADAPVVEMITSRGVRYQELAGYRPDLPDGQDLLDMPGLSSGPTWLCITGRWGTLAAIRKTADWS